MNSPHALYFHIPFCVHRCAYCDFNTYAGQDALIPAYVDALIREIELVGQGAREKVHASTIFFGGGTPSLLSVPQFSSIFDAICQNFDLHPDAEISLEANPGTLTRDYLQGLRDVGFYRLSLGVQSAHPDELQMLERIHSYGDVVSAALSARKTGFENLSFDLIFGLPEQTLDRWQATLKLIVGLRPEHLSLYALTLEHGTPFGRWAERGLLPLPDPDLAADMYEWASEYLAGEGFEQYEISNWKKPKQECQHNLQYWRNLPYLGFGAGAHGYADRMRYANVLRIQTYIDRLVKKDASASFPFSPAAVSKQIVSDEQAMQEHMMMGLRLTHEGVARETFRTRYGHDVGDVFVSEIEELMKYNLLEWGKIKTSEVSKTSEVLRLTKQAYLLGNQVFRRFVP
ncbi:MAG: radical SAM family heme chaperone HemW [Anaerolineae bacterium]|jgi:oxygen-independent coproporphyrinogen III oxidase|nr:radical SAM family heme chaperone HemW [Anaerolineae bacterium]MBT7069294.1 radical SAM family heme chaperone HemW [Anaerolineae bacterium]MBT7325990.1 radical SAM family heme chaperone HemW [Anaerolineae bacterium]